EYREAELLAARLDGAADPLAQLRQSECRPLRRYLKQEVQKDVLGIDAELEPLRLAFYRPGATGETDALQRQIDALALRRSRLYAALKQADGRPVDDQGRILWQRARERIRGQLVALEAVFDVDRRREALQAQVLSALGFDPGEEGPVPIEFLLGLDISDAGVSIGPSLVDQFLSANETLNAMDFCRWLQAGSRPGGRPIWPADLLRAVNRWKGWRWRTTMGPGPDAPEQAFPPRSISRPLRRWSRLPPTWCRLCRTSRHWRQATGWPA
ncbi:hypothetical protein ACFLSJ_06490, partial [Verrucomicrobiota bacterium]